MATKPTRRPAVSIGAYDCKSRNAAKQFGLVKVDASHRIVEFQEKPKSPKSTLVAMCLYFFPGSTLGRIGHYIQSGETKDAPGHYIQWSAKEGPVYAHVFEGSWFDIGSLASYDEANKAFEKRR